MSGQSEQTLGGVAMIASPLLLLAAAIVHPSHRQWDTALAVAASQRDRWYVGHMLVLVAMAVLVVAVLGLGRTLRVPSGGLASTGAGLTLVGTIGVGGLVGVELVVWEISHPSLDQAEMGGLVERMAGSPALIVPLFAMLAALAVGICMLALALERSRIGPRWTAGVGGVALATAIVAFPVPAVAIPAAVCALASFGPVGWIVLSAAAPPAERFRAPEGSR